MSAVAYSSGLFLAFLVSSAVSIFGLGAFDHAYGRTGSFQVATFLAFVASLLSAPIFAISSALLKRGPALAFSFVLGLLCASLVMLLSPLLGSLWRSSVAPLPLTGALFAVLAASAPLLARRATAAPVGRANNVANRGQLCVQTDGWDYAWPFCGAASQPPLNAASGSEMKFRTILVSAFALALTSTGALAHGPDVTFFYFLGGFYLVPFVIGLLVSKSGTRLLFLVYSASTVALGWLLVAIGEGLDSFFRFAVVAYLLPWALLICVAALRVRATLAQRQRSGEKEQ